MIRNIKNSSGKITGTTEILEDSIIINNIGKPILLIDDSQIIEEVLQGKISEKTLEILYNEYTMSIGEIASLYDKCYSNINKLIRVNPQIEVNHKGRRNRAYGHPVSKEQSEKMSKALQGRKGVVYERTPEMREKISQSLKEYFKQHPQNPAPHIKNWENGVYDNVDFKRGIGGYFTSIKTKTTIKFRSLLELHYLLLLEQDESVITYSYEPFHIKMENGKSYMPDFLINNSRVVELKAKKYVERVAGVKDKVNYKKSQAIQYCSTHGLEYQIIYDEDINFDTKRMKHYIKNNPNIVKQYNIVFLNPERMV